MSARWSIRTDGTPYLAFSQGTFMDLASGFQSGVGLSRMDLEFALHTLPQAFASNEEAQPLWTFRDATTGTPLLGIYVTPSGRVVGLGPDGTGPFSVIGIIRPDGVFHTATVMHDGLAGVTTLIVDGGVPIAPASTAIYALAPLTQFMLFNGTSALTRCSASVRRAAAYGPTDLDLPPFAQWDVSEGAGSTLSSFTHDAAWDFADLTLAGGFFPASSQPWGAIPESDPALNYDWRLKTVWSRQTRTPTAWKRSKVTWPS